MSDKVLLRSCLVCGSKNLENVIDFGKVNISSQSFLTSPVMIFPKGQLSIYFCKECEHMQNLCYDNQLNKFDDGYYSSSSSSKKTVKHFQSIYKKIRELCALTDKDIVLEVGCGDANFLKLFLNDGVSCACYEPSHAFEFIKGHNLLTKYNRLFDFDKDSSQYKLLIMRHVLEHLPEPLNIIKKIKSDFIYLEIPSGNHLINKKLYTDFYYDHISYFTEKSIISALHKANFKVIDIRVSEIPEFIGILASKNKSIVENDIQAKKINKNELKSFSKGLAQYKKPLLNHLLYLKSLNRRIAIWGAGARGITFMERLGINPNHIEYIVDSDDSKVGKFIPEYSESIKNKGYFYDNLPDVVVISSYTFNNEIIKEIRKNSDLIEIVTIFPFNVIKHNRNQDKCKKS